MTPRTILWWLAALAAAVHLAGARVPVSLAVAAAPRPAYSDVVFLGAILALPADTTALQAPRPLPVEPDPLPREPLEGLRAHDETPGPSLAPHVFPLEKPLPHAVTTVRITPRRAAAPIWIRGPARLRELLHRPPLAPYLQRVPIARLRSHDTPPTVDVELRFQLAPDGTVRHVEVVRSSGDPLLDLVGAQYLADWHFAPLDLNNPPQADHEPWGQVTLRLDFWPVTE